MGHDSCLIIKAKSYELRHRKCFQIKAITSLTKKKRISGLIELGVNSVAQRKPFIASKF